MLVNIHDIYILARNLTRYIAHGVLPFWDITFYMCFVFTAVS